MLVCLFFIKIFKVRTILFFSKSNRVSEDSKFYREEGVKDEGQVISNTEPGKPVANYTVMYDVNDRKWKHFEGLLILILKLISF